MPRADYYILPEADYDSRELFACRLCEKAIQQNKRVQVFLLTEDDLQQFDRRLWSFRADSFVPHGRSGSKPRPPVELTTDPDDQNSADILINLGTEPPRSAEQFDRVIELVSQQEAVLAATRASYRQRRAAGWELNRFDQRS